MIGSDVREIRVRGRRHIAATVAAIDAILDRRFWYDKYFFYPSNYMRNEHLIQAKLLLADGSVRRFEMEQNPGLTAICFEDVRGNFLWADVATQISQDSRK